MKQTKRIMIFAIIFSILFSNYAVYGATTMTKFGFPLTGSIYIKEPIEGQNSHEFHPEYRGYYEIGIGGHAGGAEIYAALQPAKIEGTADNYTFTIMKGFHGAHYSMKGRTNPKPGSLEVDGVQRSYYLPYGHDYVFKYDNKTREGRFPIWYMKSLDVDKMVPRDSVKSELEEMERKVNDIKYLAKKIKAQGEPKKDGDYHPTHALLLEEYAKDYRKIFWKSVNFIDYTAEQITASTKVLDKVIEWVENNRIQPMEILDFKVGEYSGKINKDEKKIDVYLPSGYEIKESDIKIELPDWIIARRRPGELKLGGSISYLVKPVDALYENFPEDVLPYDIYQDWTINFIEKTEIEQVQLNSLFYINSNGERIYGEINGDKIWLNIPNDVEDDKVAVNIYYFGKELLKVEEGTENKLSNTELLLLNKEITLKIRGFNKDSRSYKLTIKTEKNKEDNILDFYIDGIKTEIDDTLNTITLYPKYSDDISKLKPSIIPSYGAKVDPPSQVVQNFEKIKTYTVTSESGIAKDYNIIVKRGEASAEREIKSFKIGTIDGKIEGDTIKIVLPSNLNLKEIQPAIEISEKAKITPASGEKVDLTSKKLNYKIVAENGEVKEYKLIVEIEEVEIPGVDQELLKELKLIREGIYKRYKNSSQLTDDWDWMNIGVYEGINNGMGPYGIRKGVEDLPKRYDMYGQIGNLDHFKMTDLDRFTMSATAMGIDASNLSKYTTADKPFKFKNGQVVNNMIEEIYSKETVGGINGAAFALIALDMGNYTVPDGANYTRENILSELLEMPLDQQFDVDMVGMVIQSLYPYKEHPIYGERVKEHIDYGMDLILGQVPAKHVHPMKDDFTFESWGTVNSESVAQVICALASLGIDPHTDYRFSGNEKSLITQWINKFSTFEKNGFGHTNREYNHMATYQSMYALQWYINFLENGGGGHPYSLYYNGVPFDFGRQFSGEAQITFFELLGKSGEIDHEKGIITVTIPEKTLESKLNTEPIIKIGSGSTISPIIGSIKDFNEDIIYTVTSEDGKTKQNYRIAVEKKEGVSSGEREIEKIKISGFSALSTTIDKQNREICIVLPSEVRKDELSRMIIDLEHSGVKITPNSKEPQDYTNNVIYTIKAEDGSTSNYIVKVSIEEADKYEFTKFVLRGVEGKIHTNKNEITIKLPFGAYVGNIRPNEVDYSPRENTTSIVPASTISRSFEDENIYKIVPYPVDNTVEYNVKINYVESGGDSSITSFSIGGYGGKVDKNTIALSIPSGKTEKQFKEELKDKVPNINWTGETIDPMPNGGNNSLEDYLKDYVLSDGDGNVNTYIVKFTGGNGTVDSGGTEQDKIEITSFTVNGIKGTIDNGNGRIFLEIPFETKNYRVFPIITVSEGTSIYPDLRQSIDLRKNNIYTLQNGDTYKNYTLIVRRTEPKPATLLWRYMEEDLNIPYYQRVE